MKRSKVLLSITLLVLIGLLYFLVTLSRPEVNQTVSGQIQERLRILGYIS